MTCQPRKSSLGVPHHQIVPMHHFAAALDTEEEHDIGGGLAANFLRILGVIGDKPAADLGAVRAAHDHGIAARECAIHLDDTDGQRLLPRRSAATAPASTVSVPFGSSE